MSNLLKQKKVELKISKKHIYLEAVINNSKDFVDKLAASLAGGVDIVELSGKNISAKHFLETAKLVKTLCEEFNTTLIIADRLDIAYLVNADGIFLEDFDIDIESAKELLGHNIIIGSREQYTDFIKVSSADANLTEMDTLSSFLYGDITPEYCKTLIQSGHNKVCVSREIMGSDFPKETASILKEILSNSEH